MSLDYSLVDIAVPEYESPEERFVFRDIFGKIVSFTWSELFNRFEIYVETIKKIFPMFNARQVSRDLAMVKINFWPDEGKVPVIKIPDKEPLFIRGMTLKIGSDCYFNLEGEYKKDAPGIELWMSMTEDIDKLLFSTKSNKVVFKQDMSEFAYAEVEDEFYNSLINFLNL